MEGYKSASTSDHFLHKPMKKNEKANIRTMSHQQLNDETSINFSKIILVHRSKRTKQPCH